MPHPRGCGWLVAGGWWLKRLRARAVSEVNLLEARDGLHDVGRRLKARPRQHHAAPYVRLVALGRVGAVLELAGHALGRARCNVLGQQEEHQAVLLVVGDDEALAEHLLHRVDLRVGLDGQVLLGDGL